ncbi:MAG: hypothetical protein COT91_00410 [Candidatus Doudnabacteria bacterium CG10_big_fil_rev_8_21_14_0_10_41_10]|uniref:Methyltransferase domain-containing protein n=1 Tax=Candidatus Doudnabacteria bacterium CG10_big_fil_rev_8_21_14_0_10_41_10 TaxID=1974551 RepID=A0A2H0VH27_9BACT|nr:MAG: hypothetical protein COT91_00410 [Candidatus Doudnabacteria bacterium CG10_big_fil_rev_8_21_14_0_10_41_10]
MKSKLLEYLTCKKCDGKFELKVYKQDGAEIMEGSVCCEPCGDNFSIRGGVLRMLPASLSEDKKQTAEAFGYEWRKFTHLTDKYRDQFLSWIKPITSDFFKDKVVLDGGCGKGRHVYLAAEFGARDVIGIDLSEAIDVAFLNTRKFSNVHLIQADIYNLPFKQVFDYIYSIGVLHHLPDPKRGFLTLTSHLKPGGSISAWVYGREGNWWIEKIINPIRIGITSKLPKIITKFIAFIITAPLQLALKVIYRPINKYVNPLKKFLFYNDYLYSISGYSFQENYSIVFDHLVAPTAFYIPRDEFQTWFDEARLSEVVITWRNKNSWRGTGVKI